MLLAVALSVDSWPSSASSTSGCSGIWLYTASFPWGVAYLGIAAGLDRLGVSRVMVYMYLIRWRGGPRSGVFRRSADLARVLGGLIVLLGVILTRVALDRGARLR